MKLYYSRLVPKPFKFITLFGMIIGREEKVYRHDGSSYMYCPALTPKDESHAVAHHLQQKEMLYIFFYLWYAVEWTVRLIKELIIGECLTASECFSQAHHKMWFEREARFLQDFENPKYIRMHFLWLIDAMLNGFSDHEIKW